MNKNTLFFTLLFGFSWIIQAQEPVHIGFKGGLNFANVVGGDINDEASGRIGFLAGFSAEFYVSRSFSLQGEVLYAEQGFRFDQDSDGNGEEEELQINLNYVHFPILVKYYITNNFSATLGPQIGIKILGQSEILDSPVGAGNEREELAEFNTIDFAGSAGLCYLFEEGFFIESRYTMGVTSIFKSIEGFTSDVRNSSIQVAAGFRF